MIFFLCICNVLIVYICVMVFFMVWYNVCVLLCLFMIIIILWVESIVFIFIVNEVLGILLILLLKKWEFVMIVFVVSVFWWVWEFSEEFGLLKVMWLLGLIFFINRLILLYDLIFFL